MWIVSEIWDYVSGERTPCPSVPSPVPRQAPFGCYLFLGICNSVLVCDIKVIIFYFAFRFPFRGHTSQVCSIGSLGVESTALESPRATTSWCDWGVKEPARLTRRVVSRLSD